MIALILKQALDDTILWERISTLVSWHEGLVSMQCVPYMCTSYMLAMNMGLVVEMALNPQHSLSFFENFKL